MEKSSSPRERSTRAEENEADLAPREQNAIYQNGRIVARARDIDVELDAKEIRFGEIFNSEALVIPEEADFREYRILIQRIAFASKIQRGEEHKGRVLRGVIADLLGYRER